MLKTAVQKIILILREPLKLSFTLLLTSVSYCLAIGLRFDFSSQEIGNFERLELPLALLLFFRLFTYSYWNLHQGYWRHVSTKELKDILWAHSFSTLAFMASLHLFSVQGFPRSVVLMEYFISILFAGGSRFLTRIFCEEFLSDAPKELLSDNKQIVILGGGNSGHLLIKTLNTQKKLGLKPLCVLDDDERLQGFSIHGVPVTGRLSMLAQILASNPSVQTVVVAIPTISKVKLSELETICNSFKVSLKKLQSFEDIAFRDVGMGGDFSIEALIDRPIMISHEENVRKQLHGKSVLVTGAGGSIGSELVRQILPYGPSKVTLLDASEYNLYRIELELGKLFPEVSKRFVIANVCDVQRLSKIFSEEKPQYVFHAAAYKHVPIMESNCSQAFATNIIGTWNVLEASCKGNAERFVLISTDKAIEPSSVMGCSKRIAEWLTNQFSNGLGSRLNPEGKSLTTAVVRFGNVINSTGSVVPLFREQILSGGPITVTHPDIERYFMAIQEAVRLVLTAGTLGEKGEVFVLDMGQKIKIVDIAKKMLSLYGRTDIPIVFTGLRPGEKITEELLSKLETTSPTSFEKVSKVISPALPYDIARAIKEIEALIPQLNDLEVGQLMHKFVVDVREAQIKKNKIVPEPLKFSRQN